MTGRHKHKSDKHAECERNQPCEPGYGRDKVLFLDAFSGVSGDMLVAALVDIGVPPSVITDAIDSIPIEGYRIEFDTCIRSGIKASRFNVVVSEDQPPRDWAVIEQILLQATQVEKSARRLALKAFEILARAESEVHGVKIENVHFHEVGAVDSIVDIVAAAVCFDYIGAEVICSPLPMGRGMIHCAHGILPSPAPATLLCLREIPTFDAGIDAELVTPTGACLVSATATDFSRWPSMTAERIGWGAGSRELPDRPNLLRLVLGEKSDLHYQCAVATEDNHVLLEANIDDMSGEIAAYALQALLEAGALDVWITPILMKKNRPAIMLSALVRQLDVDRIARVFFAETTTLGLRVRPIDRIERNRRRVEVETRFGSIAIKIADGEGLPINIAPEYEECRRAAEMHRVSIKLVYAEAVSRYLAQTKK